MKAPTPRDWAHMSWHAREKFLANHAKTHRTPAAEEPDEPYTRVDACPRCGARKGEKAALCWDCHVKKREGDVDEIVAAIKADPEATGTQICERTGRNDKSGLYKLLRRHGHDDLVEQMKHNGYTHTAAASMQKKERWIA